MNLLSILRVIHMIIVDITIDSIVVVIMHSADRATTVIVIVMIAILIDLIK